MSQVFSLDSTYIHLRPDDSALAIEGGAKFWAGVEGRHDLDHGRLMGSTGQNADWNHWERHPAGDEILVLLSGELELVLDTERGEERASLKAGQTFIVPKGVWHRGIVKKPGQLMFLTPGSGTEHRPVEAR
ncbi:MAG TPA: cupin domain-containing protein [Reyranella sp.]|jgi:quercetin dioxygenase-like cupin family protein|nr:cupin domain-containing protein [Reyranella sp.]